MEFFLCAQPVCRSLLLSIGISTGLYLHFVIRRHHQSWEAGGMASGLAWIYAGLLVGTWCCVYQFYLLCAHFSVQPAYTIFLQALRTNFTPLGRLLCVRPSRSDAGVKGSGTLPTNALLVQGARSSRFSVTGYFDTSGFQCGSCPSLSFSYSGCHCLCYGCRNPALHPFQ